MIPKGREIADKMFKKVSKPEKSGKKAAKTS